MGLAFSETLAYASDSLHCPEQLLVRQKVEKTPSDWQIFNSDEMHPYVGVSFSEGPPDQKVILAPAQEKKVKSRIFSLWKFLPSTQGYWVSCLYADTSVIVSKKLPSEVQSCEVEYDADFSIPKATNWLCR